MDDLERLIGEYADQFTQKSANLDPAQHLETVYERTRWRWPAAIVCIAAAALVVAILAIDARSKPMVSTASEPKGTSTPPNTSGGGAGVNVAILGFVRQAKGELQICPSPRPCLGISVPDGFAPAGALVRAVGTLAADGLRPGGPSEVVSEPARVRSVPAEQAARISERISQIDGVYPRSLEMWVSSDEVIVVRLNVADDAVWSSIGRLLLPSPVTLWPYIEVLDGSIGDLPARPTDPRLILQDAPVSGGMFANASFELGYDSNRRCVFGVAVGTGKRVAIVWPYGYRSEPDPLTVFSFDAARIGSVGEVVQLPGGFVSDATEPCGTPVTYLVNG